MEKPQNKYLSVSYQLYTVEDGKKSLVEQTQQGRPYVFISGFGFSLDAFEQHIISLQPGEKFDFTLSPNEAFGVYDEDGVRKLSREMFSINGHFDTDNIYPGAVIHLVDSDEKRFMARVTEVAEDGVTVDVNHPLAGETLQFTGIVLENRDATLNEIQHMLNHISGEGCGCGCDDCEGGCHHDHEDCGCHHDHEDNCGCGHCHH
jgi:FKBP-type peptidyl-prolyl cis-trans isomerase SlyD